jgi:predicted transcriptional regulator
MAHPTVADVMLTVPALHPASTTVGELRAFFADEHVHMALIVGDHDLLGTVERADLAMDLGDHAPVLEIASLDGRTIGPDVGVEDALETMRSAERRRLAVVGDDSGLVGLLCLKANGRGFCSDRDVSARAAG